MPLTIPYDPALTIGNIVDPSILDNLLEISVEQAPIEAAHEKMNSLIATKRSLDMTIKELINMQVDTSDLYKSSEDLKKEIAQSAQDYIAVKIQGERQIQNLKSKSQFVHSNIESPINYNQTGFKTLPLSADSLKLDCQYFSFDRNSQSAESTISSITSYISGSASFLGNSASSSASSTAVNQISQQRENHEIQGTLVITLNCTHKNSQVLAPFILDVDKGIRVWNNLYKSDRLNIQDPQSLIKISQEEGTDKEKFFHIISGATYGSCFIGMVHILNKTSTTSSQRMSSVAAQIQAKAKGGLWFSKYSGRYGLDSSFSNDVKSMLSSQEITSHVNLISMGVIPSIKSKEIEKGVKEFADFDPASMMEKLSSFRDSTAESKKTFSSEVAEAEGEAKAVAVQGANVTNVMLGLKDIAKEKDSILNINSMMEAFDDYVNKASTGDVGIPINYYLKAISKAQLAQMWVAKYYPDEYLSISGDDSGNKE